MDAPDNAGISLRSKTIMGGAVSWTLVLIVIVMVGFVGALQVKKWARNEEEAGGDNFTLSDLRRLHKAGKMTTDEFEKARAAIVALAQKAQPKPGPAGKPAVDPLNPDGSLRT